MQNLDLPALQCCVRDAAGSSLLGCGRAHTGVAAGPCVAQVGAGVWRQMGEGAAPPAHPHQQRWHLQHRRYEAVHWLWSDRHMVTEGQDAWRGRRDWAVPDPPAPPSPRHPPARGLVCFLRMVCACCFAAVLCLRGTAGDPGRLRVPHWCQPPGPLPADIDDGGKGRKGGRMDCIGLQVSSGGRPLNPLPACVDEEEERRRGGQVGRHSARHAKEEFERALP